MVKLYTDAATNPHSQQSAAGILLVDNGQQIQLKFPLPDVSDNHQAEFLAALTGLKECRARFGLTKPVFFYSDSQIVINSLNKNYSKSYPDLCHELCQACDQFNLLVNQWLPEKENQGAHNLALQALK